MPREEENFLTLPLGVQARFLSVRYQIQVSLTFRNRLKGDQLGVSIFLSEGGVLQ